MQISGGWISYRLPEGYGSTPPVLGIFDSSGRLVQRLPCLSSPNGVNRVRWDGRNQAGEHVSPGIYFCNLRWNGEQATTRMLVVR